MHELTAIIRELAEPAGRDEKIEAIISRAARRAGISYHRAFNIYYGRNKWTTFAEADAVVRAVEEKHRKDARNELHELRTRIAVMESRLNQMDAEFYRETIDALRPHMRPAG